MSEAWAMVAAVPGWVIYGYQYVAQAVNNQIGNLSNLIGG